MARRSSTRCAARRRTGEPIRCLPAAVALACALLAACSIHDELPAPMVSSIDPDHAVAGALVTLHGDYFCQRPGMPEDLLCDSIGSVHFGAAPGTPTMWSDTAIAVEVPFGVAGRMAVTVIARGRMSNSVPFTVE